MASRRNVIPAGHGQVIGDGDAGGARRLEHAHRDLIVGAQDRVGPPRSRRAGRWRQRGRPASGIRPHRLLGRRPAARWASTNPSQRSAASGEPSGSPTKAMRRCPCPMRCVRQAARRSIGSRRGRCRRSHASVAPAARPAPGVARAPPRCRHRPSARTAPRHRPDPPGRGPALPEAARPWVARMSTLWPSAADASS